MKIGSKIREFRKNEGISARELAEKVGLKSAQAILQYERDEREPSFETLEKISNALNVKLGDLMEDNKNSKPTREWTKTAGNTLKNLRKKQELSQLELGNIVGATEKHIQNLEAGSCHTITIER